MTQPEQKAALNCSVLLIVMGAVMAFFGIGFTLFLLLQMAIAWLIHLSASPMQWPSEEIIATWRVLIAFTPPLGLAGVLFVVTGWKVRQGSATAWRIARCTALSGVAWVAALLACAYYLSDVSAPILPFRGGEQVASVLRVVNGVFGAGFYFGILALLWWTIAKTRGLVELK